MQRQSETAELGQMLADGWEVAGYSNAMMAMGATTDNVLLRKGNSLAIVTVIVNGGRELGRTRRDIA